MPVSHVGLTVAHLPTSCSFFLAALAPLGYRYIGQEGDQAAFGIDDADFFVSQETQRVKAGATQVVFTAPSQSAVLAFFTAALKAGGRVHGEPAVRYPGSACYSAAVLDFDDNSIEVMHRNRNTEFSESGKGITDDHRFLNWQKDVARDTAIVTTRPGSNATRITVNNFTTPTVAVSHPIVEPSCNSEISTKSLIGTLLGAAAGAAVAYAMTKGEEESSKATVARRTSYQIMDTPKLPSASLANESRNAYRQFEASDSQHGIVRRIEHPKTVMPVADHSADRKHDSLSEKTPVSRTFAAIPYRGTLIDTFIPPSEVSRCPPRLTTRSHTDSIVQPLSGQDSSTASRPSKAPRASSVADTITPTNYRPSTESVVTEVKVARDVPLPSSRVPSSIGKYTPDDTRSAFSSVAPSDSVSRAGSKNSHANTHSTRHGSSKSQSRKDCKSQASGTNRER